MAGILNSVENINVTVYIYIHFNKGYPIMKGRFTDSEIVIGLVGAVGTNLNEITRIISERLKRYNYETHLISISNNILSRFLSSPIDKMAKEYDRITRYMDIGNELRENADSKAIALGVADVIQSKRSGIDPPILNRTAHIIRSLKHPKEIKTLREIYGNGFIVIGVYCDKLTRKKNLEDLGTTSNEAEELIKRDEHENTGHGQHTRDAFELSDFFIEYDINREKTKNSIFRICDLIFGHPFITPTPDEFGMFMAYSASLRSADLSRQIGASIMKNNEVLAMGVNDCPKFGGGLYWPEYDPSIHKYEDFAYGRDYKVGLDSNKSCQYEIIIDILKKLKLEESAENIEILRKTLVSDLTEFGRVVHAEMEALLMCARNNISCKGATLYCTTFPCHNCAKHIIAAGIERVVYIEPYPKSRALEFYAKDAISIHNEKDRVHFEPFIGVGPRRFIEMFSMTSGTLSDRIRKDRSNPRGLVIEWKIETANIRDTLMPTSYLERESSATIEFTEFVEKWSKGYEKY